VRTGRIDEATLVERLERQGFRVRPLEALPSFYVVEDAPRPLSHTLEHWSGLLYMQQASTGLAAPALGARPGERVLDLCASPGGKAAHVAESMGDRGCLVACEIDERRIRGLLGNFYRMCVSNAMVVAGDGRTFPEGAHFDRVLVDAPCSGEGTLRRRSGEVPNQSKAFRAFVTASQRALLEKAVRLTRPGGTVLYVTCTFAPEENEEIVSGVLERAPVELEPLELRVPHAPGLVSFEGKAYDRRLELAARIYPHHLDSGGLFLAKLRRLEGDAPASRQGAPWSTVPHAFPGDRRQEEVARELVAESVAKVLARHDIHADALPDIGWIARGDTLWMHTCGEWPLGAWSPNGWRAVSVGLRAIELDPRGRPRATSDFLRFATRAVGSAVDLGERQLVELLRGNPARAPEDAPPGHVALRYGGEVVGRGAYARAELVSQLPKPRAVELARAIEGALP
jgi:NOL1/NOP2/sun family putative RNA methylase